MKKLLRLIFNRKSALEEAVQLAVKAVNVSYMYKIDKNYIPTKTDLMLFDCISKVLQKNQQNMEYICCSMRKRFDEHQSNVSAVSNPSK
ncbi:MAG: hypothetical protein R3D71_05430 [Rickettsiales bacterium]